MFCYKRMDHWNAAVRRFYYIARAPRAWRSAEQQAVFRGSRDRNAFYSSVSAQKTVSGSLARTVSSHVELRNGIGAHRQIRQMVSLPTIFSDRRQTISTMCQLFTPVCRMMQICHATRLPHIGNATGGSMRGIIPDCRAVRKVRAFRPTRLFADWRRIA